MSSFFFSFFFFIVILLRFLDNYKCVWNFSKPSFPPLTFIEASSPSLSLSLVLLRFCCWLMDIEPLWGVGGWFFFLNCMATASQKQSSSHFFVLFLSLFFSFLLLLTLISSPPSMASDRHHRLLSASSTAFHPKKSRPRTTSPATVVGQFGAEAHEVPSGPNPISN